MSYCISQGTIFNILCVCACVLSCFSCAWLFTTLQTIACQAPLSMRFSRQEYRSGLPCPTPGKLPDPGIKTMSLRSVELVGGFFTTNATWEAHLIISYNKKRTRWRIYIYIRKTNHFGVTQKLTQYCKSAKFQFFKNQMHVYRLGMKKWAAKLKIQLLFYKRNT